MQPTKIKLFLILYTRSTSYLIMNTIRILAILAILSGVATLSISGFTVLNTVVAQMGDNASMGNLTIGNNTLGNMTGGNVTGGNTTGSISALA
jgi:hypothetical protein